MSTLLSFLFVLGVLVFVHELGHFLLARWHGVRVLTFSLGFGPKLLSLRRGDTEYCVSAVPLGGYVKMAGETPDEGDGPPAPDEFFAKTKWQRFQIYLAGPAMNVLTAIVIMTVVYMYGAPEPAYLKNPAEVVTVAPGSPAERAGIRPGDVIVRAAGEEVTTWEQLDTVILPKAGRELTLTVRRGSELIDVTVTPDAKTKYELGDIGVAPAFRPQVRTVFPGTPAERAGVRPGDVIEAVNGTPVDDQGLLKTVRANPGRSVTLTIRRNGERIELPVTPTSDGEPRIGVEFRPYEERLVAAGFAGALRLSLQKNLEWSTLIFRTFGGLFAGETSPKQLMGPVGIAQLSGGAARQGAVTLFTLMAMISLNLAILNLLPIPMLDGGHIFIMALEGAARRDFSLRLKERLLIAGFVVIMTLMVTVIYNDLMRVEWIERLVPWR
ncbi:MAG TPA: RIP metalloprotease RseP [Vicinamibacterales bacterium]